MGMTWTASEKEPSRPPSTPAVCATAGAASTLLLVLLLLLLPPPPSAPSVLRCGPSRPRDTSVLHSTP